MNVYFSGKSIRSKGTLSYLKAAFQRKNVSTSVKDSFNHVWEFVKVTNDLAINNYLMLIFLFFYFLVCHPFICCTACNAFGWNLQF